MTLIICEKNNAANRIAHILSGGRASKQSKYQRPYYTFDHEGETYDVIGLRGHIVSLDYPAKYNSWYKVKPRDLVMVEPITAKKEKSIIRALVALAKAHNEVVVATDFDREGELIGKEALDVIRTTGKEFVEKRARFSALTKQEITSAFEAPGAFDLNLSNSAFTRSFIDLVWGASLTRFFSLTARKRGKDFLSVGRVQTPTLSLLVDREKEIEAFNPIAYWTIKAELKKEKVQFKVSHKTKKFWKKEEMELVMEKVSPEKFATIMKVSLKGETRRPPAPFNTTSFIRDATKLRFSAVQAMSLAESLYTRGLISYPRTDNTVYPRSLSLSNIVSGFTTHSLYADFALELLKKTKLTPTRGKKETTDHPPIYPVKSVEPGKLSRDEQKIYDLVVTRFFATLGDNCKLEKGAVNIAIAQEPFQTNSLRVMVPGWTRYYQLNNIREKSIPSLVVGEVVDIVEVSVDEKETKPPKRYNQGSLIVEMEEKGLGTKSTRHGIIQKLIGRGYATSTPLGATISGKALISSMKEYSELITLPVMTQKLEEDMERVSGGTMGWEEVASESRKMLLGIFDMLEKNQKSIGDTLIKALRSQDVVGECPECKNEMLIRRSRRGKRFVGCGGFPKCRNTFPLPQNGVVIADREKCPECSAPIVKVIKKGKKPWIICINMGCKHNENKS